MCSQSDDPTQHDQPVRDKRMFFAGPANPAPAAALRAGLEGLRDHGYQPMYNGRPSCPFCLNFVDDEETHRPGCVLVAALKGTTE